MGQRINFYKNRTGKPIKELVFEHYADFRVWYLQRNQDSIARFNETYGSEELLAYFAQDTDFVSEFDMLDDRLINELLVEFVHEYQALFISENHLFEFFGLALNTWRYGESTKMVWQTKDTELIRLWSCIIQGRTLKNSTEFVTYDGEAKVGFLTVEEQRRLKELILHYFEDVQALTDHYWSTTALEEKKKYSENSVTGYPLLSPPTEGLNAMLFILKESEKDLVELVTGIGTNFT